MREELIKYLSRIVDFQEQTYWLKWDSSDLDVFAQILQLDKLSRDKPSFSFWTSVIDLIPNNK